MSHHYRSHQAHHPPHIHRHVYHPPQQPSINYTYQQRANYQATSASISATNQRNNERTYAHSQQNLHAANQSSRITSDLASDAAIWNARLEQSRASASLNHSSIAIQFRESCRTHDAAYAEREKEFFEKAFEDKEQEDRNRERDAVYKIERARDDAIRKAAKEREAIYSPRPSFPADVMTSICDLTKVISSWTSLCVVLLCFAFYWLVIGIGPNGMNNLGSSPDSTLFFGGLMVLLLCLYSCILPCACPLLCSITSAHEVTFFRNERQQHRECDSWFWWWIVRVLLWLQVSCIVCLFLLMGSDGANWVGINWVAPLFLLFWVGLNWVVYSWKHGCTETCAAWYEWDGASVKIRDALPPPPAAAIML